MTPSPHARVPVMDGADLSGMVTGQASSGGSCFLVGKMLASGPPYV